jgi:ComF family protein
LVKFLGNELGKIIVHQNILLDLDLIIPVPLHKNKQKLRGYNQSAYFGYGLSEAMNVSCSDKYLFRVKDTETQTKKNRIERIENVSFAFHTQNIDELHGKHILLVDDVVTTGATIEACAQTLLNTSEIRDLSIATIAVAE